MEGKATSIPNYGKAINVGEVSMQQQQNTIAPDAEVVQMKDESRQWLQITTNNYNSSPVPSPWPDNTAAAWVQCRSGIPIPREQVVWSKAAGDYTSTAEDARQRDQIEGQWSQTISTVGDLDAAISAFQSRSRRELCGDDDTEDSPLPWTQIQQSAYDELKRAIDLYSTGFQKQSSILRNLQDVNRNMAVFSSWLKALHTDQHRSSLCAAMRYIFAVVADEEKLDDCVVEIMATVFRAFGSDLVNYLATIETDRLTAAMVGDTIDIFESLAAIFIPLLKSRGRKVKSSQRETIDTEIKGIEDRLLSVNNAARSRHNPRRNNSLLQSQEVPRVGDLDVLVVRHYFHFIESTMPPQPFLPDRKSSDAGISTSQVRRKTQLLHRSSTLQKDSGLSATTLINYLCYNAAIATAGVEQCLSLAKPNPKNMQKLAMLTQRDVYQSWLKDESQSSALLVHGRSQPTALVSPLSYLCARISREYTDEDKIIVLSYFCGLRARDRQADATDLLCQMIGQLLSHKEAVKACQQDPIERNWGKNIKQKDFETLLRVFSTLIEQLRQYQIVIFGLIDSISKIETSKQRKDTESLLRELNKIVRKQQGRQRKSCDRMVFKLLVTDEARSLVAHNFFSNWDTIDMIAGGFGSATAGLKF